MGFEVTGTEYQERGIGHGEHPRCGYQRWDRQAKRTTLPDRFVTLREEDAGRSGVETMVMKGMVVEYQERKACPGRADIGRRDRRGKERGIPMDPLCYGRAIGYDSEG